MPSKGQIISFFIVFVVIVGGAWQAISHGENLKQAKELIQPAFVAQESDSVRRAQNSSPEPEFLKSDFEGVLKSDFDSIESEPATTSETAFILIDDGAENPKEFVLEISTSTTAFDLLQEAGFVAGLAVESQEYDFGVFIEAINDKRNRQDNKYWLFYVNGELSQLTPDKVVVNSADKIEFIFTNR